MTPPHAHAHSRHPGKPAPHERPHRSGIPASQILAFIDPQRFDASLRLLVGDVADRAFVGRCLTGEGPLHHRGANYILIALLGELLQQLPESSASEDAVDVPMRLPPHLADVEQPGNYPLRLPMQALRRLAGGDPILLEAMIDCLTDGPPQHALANVALVALIDRLSAALPSGR
ncbi:MAG: hypothetical protein U5L74_10095 [Ideonella sp.]|nr:hypothetical protein [Ideonella sp.]